MSTSLGVGVPAGASYLRTVLNQLGLPAIVVNGLEDGLDQGIRVLFWNDATEISRLADAAIPECRVITVSVRATAPLTAPEQR
jgi:hypothetical protein